MSDPAPPSRCPIARGAFTLVELLVVIAIIAVLVGLLLAALNRSGAAAREVRCLTNLRSLWSAFHFYTEASAGRLPDPWASRLPWERLVESYIETTAVLRCPADEELFGVVGSSYDWRDTGDPATTLAGRRLPQARPSAVLIFDSLPDWHRQGYMNAARVDGSAEAMEAAVCLGDLMAPVAR